MATPARILSLSLGNQTVALAEFKTDQHGRLVLAAHHNRELLADPAADSTRLAQTKLVLDEMVQAAGLKKAKTNYAVSAQSVFTRFVKLPSVGEEQVDQIVTFEAQQNVPYPIDEVVWDYQLVDSGDPAQVEVVIVAIKSDLLDDINTAVEDAHLQTSLVDVAPMALYNAYRYNYSDVDGCSLIIDIGARTTNLIFIEPHKVFSRSIPNGGCAITQAIARDFNEPFGVAEERKKRDGFVSLGGAYSEPEDPDVARVSKMIRNSMTRLHAEIARSIGFYRAQQGGTAPQRIYLAGGSVTLPYMPEFFSEKLQLPVEFFNPLRNVTVGGGLNLEEIGRNAHRMGELVGLALRSTSSCPMELNLRPASVVRRHELAERRPYILLAGVCTLLAVTGWWLYFDHATLVTNQVSDQLKPKVDTLKSFETRMNAARAATKAQQDTVAPLLTAVDDRVYWVKIIEDINTRLPKDYVWVTSLARSDEKNAVVKTEPGEVAAEGAPAAKGKHGPVLMLKGLWLYNDRKTAVVDDFVKNLKESPLYEVATERDEGFRRAVENDAEWAYDFAIPLVLKNAPSLPASPK